MKSNFKFIFKLFTVVIFFTLINGNLLPIICFNGAGGGYEEPEANSAANIDSLSIEDYIVEGGGYYLQANAAIQKMLQTVEWQDVQGIDYIELQKVVDEAIIDMQGALAAYRQLIREAGGKPYNQDVLARLAGFDYEAFMAENLLNPYIFGEVGAYLKTGNITGIFRRTYDRFTGMAGMLEVIAAGVSRDTLPGIAVFRKLNETAAEVSLFGSYVAGVFSAVPSN